jgi:hypothetical protein
MLLDQRRPVTGVRELESHATWEMATMGIRFEHLRLRGRTASSSLQE